MCPAVVDEQNVHFNNLTEKWKELTDSHPSPSASHLRHLLVLLLLNQTTERKMFWVEKKEIFSFTEQSFLSDSKITFSP